MQYFEITVFPPKGVGNVKSAIEIKNFLENSNFIEGNANFSHPVKLVINFDPDEESIGFPKEFKESSPLVELYQYEDREFDEIYVALPDFPNRLFTKADFKNQIAVLSQMAAGLFERVPDVKFATGMYEMTWDYIENLFKMTDFDKNVFENFPIMFWKTSAFDKDELTGEIIYSNEQVTCTYNDKAQIIWGYDDMETED